MQVIYNDETEPSNVKQSTFQLKKKILTVEPQFLLDDKRVGGDKSEEEFQIANRVTQYPAYNNKSQEKCILVFKN